jgi:hypothetical protein
MLEPFVESHTVLTGNSLDEGDGLGCDFEGRGDGVTVLYTYPY